ncbi:MAG TPA: acylphosphatase [Bryobacteraceae bacterium]|jgi:acylphosphatase
MLENVFDNVGMKHHAAKRWFVSGIVQGVGFRFFVQQKASMLGLSGWARNLDDGRVEVYATGTNEQLSDLAAALHVGPLLSQVRGVSETEDVPQKITGFSMR